MTMTQAEWRARVPDADQREEWARLWEAARDAEAALEKAEEGVDEAVEEKYEAMAAAVEEEYRPKFEALRVERDARLDAIEQQKADELGIPHLRTANKAAHDAYQDENVPGVCTVESVDGLAAERCALSGVPIVGGDEVIVDEDTGEAVLRCLILPPRAGEASGKAAA